MVVPFVVRPRICGAGKAKCRDCNHAYAEIFQDHFRFPPSVLDKEQSRLKIKVPKRM
jgi:hypothetical protein